MPELSVIMGVYNCPAKEMLVQAIDSILNQTYRDFEFIICDDGSKNDTFLWLQEKAKQDERITLIESNENKGLADALNQCLKKATGQYIARQDVDDYSTPTRFDIQLQFLREHPSIAFVGTACFVYDKNGLYGEWHRPEYPSRRDFLFNSPFIHGTVMFRREVFNVCGGYELIGRCRKYEDYAFFMHAYAKGFQGANINQLLYTFYSEEKKNMVSRTMRLDEYSVRKQGFKELGIGLKRIPYLWKPIILILVPNKLLNSLKDNKKNSLMHKKSLLLRMYKVVVNRNPYIKTNYERYVNGNRVRHRRFPILSWLYLLKLNIEYGFAKTKYKTKRRVKGSMTEDIEQTEKKDYALELAEKLCRSDIVSFDLFDTMIFRPFAVPSDIFYCVGERLNYPDFKTIRTEAEKTVRETKGAGLSLKDIYEFIENQAGIDAKTGCRIEMEVEEELAIPNPLMKKVWDIVQERGKRVIVSADMYLPKECISRLLAKTGYTGAEQIFVSCECGVGKHEGTMYEYIKNIMGSDNICHIGDNKISDVKNAKKHGIRSIEYRNVNLYGNRFRPKDMLQTVGSAYSGIVNSRLYRGDLDYSPAFEYGYKYGGIILIGLCEHIHRQLQKNEADGVLFLSEGGYIVKKIYDKIYPDDKTAYVYWSEYVASKLLIDDKHEEFIDFFVTQKIGKGSSVYDIMEKIGIADWKFPFVLNKALTDENAAEIVQYLTKNKKKIAASYGTIRKAAEQYLTKILLGDVKEKLKDTTDSRKYLCMEFASSGKAGELLKEFIYCNKNINCTIENSAFGDTDIYNRLLFGSSEPTFLEYKLNRDSKYELVHEENVKNEMYIWEIQKGESEFVDEYLRHFNKYSVIKSIPLGNATKPLEYAKEHDRRYIDMVFADCIF